jgi:phosphoglycerol transferase MdoB-like AlkP superfamily enzyme
LPNNDPTATPRRPPWGLLWLAAVLLAASLVRAWLVTAGLAGSAGCEYCRVAPVLGHDAVLLAAAWGGLALAALASSAWLRALFVFPALLAMLVMAADVAVFTTLGMRLYVFDVLKFGMEGAAFGGFVAALLRSSGAAWLVVATLALLGGFAALWPAPPSARWARNFGVAAAFAALVAGATRLSDPAFINADGFLNVVELHYAQSVNTPYSPAFVEALARRDASIPQQCRPGQQRRPDVIVLAVESLSSYQSALLGGPLDLMPELDAVARANTWFTHFHANGFSTDAGLIALLTGRPPVPAVGRYRSTDAFAGFDDPARSVAVPLHDAGYEAAFFTTGDLGFLDKKPWLARLGFDHVEGAEAPFYEGWPRFGFNAAEDRALYLRLFDWMDKRDAARPFFAFALTVQSHPPFVDPKTGLLDEPVVFRAVDREIGRFVRELDARGFFAHGVLLVTGDHRSMTPLHAAERKQHGTLAFARVPLVVVGASGLPRGAVDAPFQQTDLLPSLADLAGAQACTRLDQGRFLRADPQPPSWVLHARGDARNRVDVHFGDRHGALLLRGDDSEWIGDRPPQWQAIADGIHRDRIERGALDSDIQELIRILGKR